MRRNEPHEIDTRAQRVFEYFLPDNIVIRRQSSDDYGIDAEVELFENGKSTGTIFKVQLKGKKHPTRALNGKFITFSYPVRKGTYLIEQVEIPTIFVMVDVTKKIAFWCDIHGNDSLIEAYNEAKKSDKDHFTVYFDTSNVLPETLPQLFDKIVKAANHIALRRVAKIKPPTYADYISKLKDADIENELRHLSEKNDIAYITKLTRLLELNEYDEAEDLIDKIIQSTERSPEAKFDALLQLELVFVNKYNAHIDDMDQEDWDAWRAEGLTHFAKESGDQRLMLLAQGYTLSAELGMAANLDLERYLNWNLHSASQSNDSSLLDPFLLSMLSIERNVIEKMVIDKYEELSQFIPTLIEHNLFFVPDIVTRIILHMNIYFMRLREERLYDKANKIEEIIESLITFAMNALGVLPDQNHQDAIIDRCCKTYELQLSVYKDQPEVSRAKYETATKIATNIHDQSLKIVVNKRLQDKLEANSRNLERTIIDWDGLESFYRKQAKAFGFDLSLADKKIEDVNDPNYTNAKIAWIINLGIEDLNPTRVLKNCEHLIFEYTGGIGDPARMMNLYSARRKLMACIKHLEHGAIETYSIDELYRIFYEEHCSKCPHSKPHAPNWQFTPEWHEERHKVWQLEREKYGNQDKR